MCYEQMGELLNKTEKYDPITPKMVKGIMENDSRAVKSLADRWNWDWLGQEAQRNIDKPEEGVAKASVATGLGFLGAGAGNAAHSAVAAGGSAAPGAGVVAPGMQGYALMDSALINAGLSEYAGLMGTGTNAGGKLAQKFAMNQAMGMMNPQPRRQAPPPPPPPPPQPMPSPYMSEEEKRRLMMQRGIY